MALAPSHEKHFKPVLTPRRSKFPEKGGKRPKINPLQLFSKNLLTQPHFGIFCV
jgi:hypothetical protein